ncbi:unnamed protein product [Larinioides sclopetarius]|uniref:Uncharacterized protein n=1 Tax=Larinioides sclopetarius TaxID=280406 RepID=A0AAV1Z4R7_9ARAC
MFLCREFSWGGSNCRQIFSSREMNDRRVETTIQESVITSIGMGALRWKVSTKRRSDENTLTPLECRECSNIMCHSEFRFPSQKFP